MYMYVVLYMDEYGGCGGGLVFGYVYVLIYSMLLLYMYILYSSSISIVYEYTINVLSLYNT